MCAAYIYMYTKNIIEWKVIDPLYTVSHYINMFFQLHIVQMSSKKTSYYLQPLGCPGKLVI